MMCCPRMLLLCYFCEKFLAFSSVIAQCASLANKFMVENLKQENLIKLKSLISFYPEMNTTFWCIFFQSIFQAYINRNKSNNFIILAIFFYVITTMISLLIAAQYFFIQILLYCLWVPTFYHFNYGYCGDSYS